MKLKQILLILLCWTIGFSTFAEEDYPGSQAYNKTLLGHESVNAATGTFDYSYPLISAKGRLSTFQLHLSYRFNKEGMFSLPNGWQLDLDFIKSKSAYIHGQDWLIDLLWRDETGFGSGLRYYNLHGTRFSDDGEAREVPNHKGVFYRYRSTHKDGSIKYFSHQGLIVIEEDRFGNFIQFDYEKPISSLRAARLKTLTDNYGNQYRFDYVPGGLTLTAPDNKKTHVYFNKNGVEAIENTIGQRTEFKYVSFAGRNLLRTIETPKGLMTQISYDTISYSNGSDKKQMPVVGLLEKMDLATNKKIEETHYAYSEDNNFTGYPMYSLSNSGDNLMDSQNKSYRYSVEITRSDLIGSVPQNNRKVYYYNYLHLPTEVITLKDGVQYLRTTYEYSISPFKYSRSTNYDKPRKTINWIWDENYNVYTPSDKILTKYDRYGNKTEENRMIFDRVLWNWKISHSQKKSYYNDAFGLEKENIRTDAFTGQILRSTYTLSKDKKSHAYKTIDYKPHAKSAWEPWQQIHMQHDNFGRKTASSTQWLAKGQPGPQKTSYSKSYDFNTQSRFLTVKQTSALGAVNGELQDTRSGNLLEKHTPVSSVWQYEYDDLDRLIKETNPLGKATLYTHHDFDKDRINQIIKETPLHYKIATVMDAAGRVIEHKDYYQNIWRRLSAVEYNGWNKVVKQTNILGLENITIYDQHERPVKHIDHWGNIKRIDYSDLHLITTTHLNQHKLMEKETQPWLAKTIHRKYPIFDNPHDPQSHFLEETLEKNGFGQAIKHTSTLIHRHTQQPKDAIQSVYTYDPSFNRISKTIDGYDGLHFTRTTEYDLFKNVVKHTKEQTKNDETSRRDTDLKEYNADNQLILVVSPEKMTTQHINDKAGRRIKTIQPDGSDILFEYNLLGQIVKQSWMRGGKRLEITKTYNDDNHLVTLSDNDGQAIQYHYLPNGNVRSIIYPDGQEMMMDYDDKNRVITRTDFANKRYHLIYDEDDKGEVSQIQVEKNRIQFNYGEDNNTIKGNLISRIAAYDSEGETKTQFYYGAFRNLTKTTHFSKPTGTVFNTSYHHNSRGQLESIANHSHQGHKPSLNTLQKYQYDSLNRLVSELHDQSHLIQSIDYSYDANNNLLTEDYHDGTNQHSITHQYNGQDQRTLSSVKRNNETYDEHYTWDKNGHLQQTPSTTEFEYDSQGYLMTMKHPDFATIDYHYLPNGLLGKRTRNQKDHLFYHGVNKKISAIKNEDQWYSLFSDKHGLQANIAGESVDQFFVSGRDSGGILSSNKNLQTTTYTAYGKPVTPFKQGDISSSFGWNQEYLDQDANLTYLQRRFYEVDLKLFLSRDSYDVDNHYMYGRANPITFIDPTGHNAQQGVSYGVGGGLAALGIIGAALAVPTGGASLTLSAGAGIAAGATASLSGIALMGSQGALDSGNKQAAKALQYTSIGLSAAALIAAGVAIAPIIAPSYFISASSAFSFIEPSELLTSSYTPTMRYIPRFLASTSGGLAGRTAARVSLLEPKIEAAITETIDQHLTISGESQVTFQASVSSVGSASGEYVTPTGRFTSSAASPLTEAGNFGPAATSLPAATETDGAIFTKAITIPTNSAVLTTTPTSDVATTTVIPGTISTEQSISADMTGANAAFSSTPDYGDLSGAVGSFPNSYGYGPY